MAAFLAHRIVTGKEVFLDVPIKLRKAVAEILIDDYKLPELVTVEYGGTLDA